MLVSELEAAPIAVCKELILISGSVVPDRTYGVEDKLRRKTEARGGLGVACFTAVELSTGLDKRWPCGAMNGPVNAPAAQQGRVCSVYDGIDGQGGDVCEGGFQRHGDLDVLVGDGFSEGLEPCGRYTFH